MMMMMMMMMIIIIIIIIMIHLFKILVQEEAPNIVSSLISR